MKKTSDKIDQQGRQGDVMMQRRGELPANAKPTKRDEHGRVVLAHGEVTGHAHAFRNRSVCGYSTLPDGEIDFVVVGGSGAPLRHELISGAKAEHDALAFAPGVYELPVQVEHAPKQSPRVVAD